MRKRYIAAVALVAVGGALVALRTSMVRNGLEAKIRAECSERDPGAACVTRMRAMGHIWSQAGDLEKAEHWYHEAAERGDTAAMFHLAWVYDKRYLKAVKSRRSAWVPRWAEAALSSPKVVRRSGGKSDLDLAKKWYRAAANRGFAPAMNNLGAINLRGKFGSPASGSGSFVMFMSAAKAGNPVAHWNLAIAYTAGLGVTPNAAQAEKWQTWTPPAKITADLKEPTLTRTKLLTIKLSTAQRAKIRSSVKTGEAVTMSQEQLTAKPVRCALARSTCR